MHFRLSVCIFAPSREIAQNLIQILSEDRYYANTVDSLTEFVNFIEQHKEQIDCLLVVNNTSVSELLNKLYEEGTLLPVVILEENKDDDREGEQGNSVDVMTSSDYIYHSGEVRLRWSQLAELSSFIDQAITQFLHLAPSCAISERPTNIQPIQGTNNAQTFLMLQQRRLAEKLKERLGYLGIYYKRNPQYFCRNLSQEDREELLSQLNLEYRRIILNYFAKDDELNQKIDEFVNRAFFSDLSISQILEIHMELMDEFSQQLKLEGRNEEILLDYRLTLIDVIAHLCEMYRRSIPREDLPFELLFCID